MKCRKIIFIEVSIDMLPLKALDFPEHKETQYCRSNRRLWPARPAPKMSSKRAARVDQSIAAKDEQPELLRGFLKAAELDFGL